MGYGIVKIDKPVNASAGVRHYSVAKGSIADSRTTESTERDIRIGEPAESEHGERSAETVARKADLHSRVTLPIIRDDLMNFLPHFTQRALKTLMY